MIERGRATFAYDGRGNPTLKWHQGDFPRTMSYDGAGRLLTMLYAAAATTYTYDGAGNQTTESTAGVVTGYAYDGENRLTKVTHPDGSLSTYSYQGSDGLRRTRQEPGQALVTTAWDGASYLGEI